MNYTISDTDSGKKWNEKRIAVVAHVNYTDMIDKCFFYIERIPRYIDIYITTKGSQNIGLIGSKIESMNRENIRIVVPEDRGREISGLLVACREFIMEYEYLCFVHDKKKNKGEPYQTVGQSFCDLLWENTLKSSVYIENIIDTFEKDPCLGLLAPPPPFTSHFFMVGFMGWTGCFDKTKQLAKDLNLKCKMDEQESPFILGTTFWCRKSALLPLLMRKWSYSDFEPEPMPLDNTISHAIERILPFVVQSQGYNSGLMMTQEYASLYEVNYQYMYDEILNKLNDVTVGISEKDNMDNLSATNRLARFLDKTSYFYIYGAGKKGTECLAILGDLSKFKGFIVSNGHKTTSSFEGYPVFEIDEIRIDNNLGIIIAMRSNFMIEVYSVLVEMGVKNIERYI